MLYFLYFVFNNYLWVSFCQSYKASEHSALIRFQKVTYFALLWPLILAVCNSQLLRTAGRPTEHNSCRKEVLT